MRYTIYNIASKYIGILLGILLISISIDTQFSTYINQDIAWNIHVANQILDGKKLYTDFIDPNPPLIFYYSMLPVFLSNITDIDLITSSHITDIYIALFCIFITLLTFRYTKYSKDIIFSNLFNFTICVIIFILPLCSWANSFFNKDVMVVPFILPYLLLALNRLDNVDRNPNILIRIIIGLMGGFAFSIKPFFIILYIIIELALYNRTKKIEIKKNIEIPVAAFFIIFYLFSIFILTPEYLTNIIPIINFTHPLFTNKPEIILLFFSGLIIIPLASLILANIVKTCEFTKLFSLVIMTLSAISLIQNKGWVYHAYPAIAVGYIVIIKIISDIITSYIDNRRKNKNFSIKSAFVISILIIVSYGGIYKSYERFHDLYNSDELKEKYSIQAINKIINKSNKQKPNILILSEYLHHTYPAIIYSKGETFFSIPFLFPITAIENYKYLNKDKPEKQVYEELEPIKKFMFKQINSYIEKYKPDIIISRDYANFHLRRKKEDLNIVEYLKDNNTDFIELMQNYNLDKDSNNLPYNAYYIK